MVRSLVAGIISIMPYEIVYEDKNILVVDKPPGISVHPDAHRLEGTLIQAIRETHPGAELAHRLDKDTSGLVLVAKNIGALEYLKGLFKERKIHKKYLALVVGEVKKEEDVILLGITRSKKDFRKRVATKKLADKARAAETHYKVAKRYAGFTFLEVSPKTGRTHQIRSHLSAIGYPVACDPLYGGKRFICPGSLARQFLHAFSFEFTTIEGKQLRLEADLPPDLEAALSVL